MRADRVVARAGRASRGVVVRIDRRLRAQDLAAGPIEGDPSVVAAKGPTTHPRDLAHRTELVEETRRVAGKA